MKLHIFILLSLSVIAPVNARELDLKIDRTKKIETVETKPKQEVRRLSQDMIETRETVVSFNNVLYRRVEYDNKAFYVRFEQPDGEWEDKKISCELPGPSRVRVESKVIPRKRVFLEGLRVGCENSGGQKRAYIDPNPALGINLDPNKTNTSVSVPLLAPGLRLNTEF